MAYMCVKNHNRECDLCGGCKQEPEVKFTCEDCGCDICEGEYYYDIQGTILCEDCIDNYKFLASSIF